VIRLFSKNLICPIDSVGPLEIIEIPQGNSYSNIDGCINNGVLFCPTCGAIYPIIHGIARLIAPELARVDHWREHLFFEKQLFFFDKHPALKRSMQKRLTEQSITKPNKNMVGMETEWWNNYYRGQIDNINYIKTLPRYPDLAAGNRLFDYDEWFAKFLMVSIEGQTIIEVGCGKTAFVYLRLPPDIFNYCYVGIDSSFDALLLASQLVPGQFYQCNVEALPFGTLFDTLICLGVLHHLDNWQKALGECFRVLKPGGVACLSEAVTKKRFFARWRTKSFTAIKDSPNEGSIPEGEFINTIKAYGEISMWIRCYSTVRFILEYLLKLNLPMDKSRLLTKFVISIDRFVLSTLGKIFTEFQGGEIAAIICKQTKIT
jgi:SAM-dependent methyltransferase/uncharacterized protein YbaR (Trm112 family)